MQYFISKRENGPRLSIYIIYLNREKESCIFRSVNFSRIGIYNIWKETVPSQTKYGIQNQGIRANDSRHQLFRWPQNDISSKLFSSRLV